MVETKKKKSFFSRTPSWVLSLITAFLSVFVLMFLASILSDVAKSGDIGESIAYISYGILIAIGCFFICRHNPKSIWYVPILCNIFGIISAVVEPNFWITSLWMVICGGWVLSLLGAIAGTIAGQRTIPSKQEWRRIAANDRGFQMLSIRLDIFFLK